MTTKNIYYYSSYAASEYGTTVAETLDGQKIQFTGVTSEDNPADYQWNDKKLIGIFEPQELINSEYIPPISRQEHQQESKEQYFSLLYKDKTPEQIYQESYEYTKNLIDKEKENNKKEQVAKISVLRSIYNACNPLPSSKKTL